MSILRHASIGKKVALAPTFAILCLVIVAGMGLWANRSATTTLAQINKERMPALGLAADLERRIAAVNASAGRSLVWEGAGAKADTIAALDKSIGKDFEEIARLLEAQSTSPVWSEVDRATLKQIGQVVGKFKAAVAESLDMKSAGLAAAAGFITRSESSYAELNRLIADLVKRQHESVQGAVTGAEVVGAKGLWAAVVGLGIAVVLSALATVWCARLIARPLGQVVRVLEAVAAGDFTRRLRADSRDEVGQAADALNQAVEAMQGALRDVGLAANQAAIASAQLSAASAQLSSGAQEQAASLEETAASLEQITGTVKQNADNARQANQLAVGSRDTAEKGGAVVESAVVAMDGINRSSKKIADIITTIDEIAFQTNLLALNAAVEAARAGEQGRGFAVVAAEVRNLAQRSATAAKEIKELIQESVGKVEGGAALVNRSGETLREIVASTKRVTDIVAEIAAASQEQTAGVDQVNKAVTQMDQVVQANAAQTEELSSTAQGLAAQAAQLQELVARFKLDAEGRVPAPAAAMASAGPMTPAGPRPAGRPRPAPGRGPARALVGATVANGHAADGPEGFEEF